MYAANVCGKAVRNCKITAPHNIRQKQGGRWNLRAYQNMCTKAMRLSENWRPSSASAYYLGSAESPTSDFFQVWLKSSRSGDVASRSCSPQVTWALKAAQLIWAASLPYCTGCWTGMTCQNICARSKYLRAPESTTPGINLRHGFQWSPVLLRQEINLSLVLLTLLNNYHRWQRHRR